MLCHYMLSCLLDADSRARQAFKGHHWKALTLLTAFLFPGIVFGIFFLLNFFIWGKRSSGVRTALLALRAIRTSRT